MKKNNLKRFLASLLAVLMLSQVTGVAPGVFADWNSAATQSAENVEPVFQEYTGEVLIKSGWGNPEILDALATAFVQNKDSVDVQAINWTYKCEGSGKYEYSKATNKTATRTNVGSIFGFTTSETEKNWRNKDVTFQCSYPALAINADGAYELYANGALVGTIHKVGKLSSAINVKTEVATIAIPYTSATEYDENALNESIFNAYVTSTTPADLTYDKLSFTGTVAEGQQTITISYAGDEDHYGTNAPVTVNFVDNRIEAFSAKEKPENISAGFVKNDANAELTVKNIREALVNQLSDLDLSEVSVGCKSSINALGGYDSLSDTGLKALLLTDTKADIKLTYAGSDTYKPFTAEFKGIKFADNRVASSIVLKENASITYNMDAANMKEQIFNSAIDWDASELPAKETLSIADFEFECNTSLISKIPVWKDIAGDEYPNLNAGDKRKIRVSFVGNSDFKPCDNKEATIKVAKAHVDVSMNAFTKAYAGNEDDLTIEKLGITLNPNDPRIDIYRVFVGINTNLKASVNLVLTDKQWEFIENVSKAQAWLYDKAPSLFPSFNETIQDKLEKGMTIAEFKEYMNNAITAIENAANDETWGPIVQGGLDLFHIDLDAIKALASVFDVLTMVSDDLTIAVGVPKHAGLYRVYAIAANKNYETNFASGTVLILMNWKDIKIVPNADLKKQTITVSVAEKYASGELAAATLLNKSTGESSGIDQSALHYRFTGLNKIYSSHDFPTAPGKYIVTVSVRGGDYYALPTTFTFTVKAD